MNIVCEKSVLANYISIVMKAVSSKTTLPILECILLTANDDGFFLTGTDLEIGIQTKPMPATIRQEGKIAIEAKFFNDVIRRLEGDMVTIVSESPEIVIIRCGTSEFKIMAMDSEEFPNLPEVEKTKKMQIEQVALKNMIRQTIFSVAQEGGRPVLLGELFEIKNDSLELVAIDGSRISYRKETLEQNTIEDKVIVPGKTLQELMKVLSQEENELVDIYVTDKHILFDIGTAVVVSLLIAGEYIAYSRSFFTEFQTQVIIDKIAFIQALERASLVAREVKKTPVIINIKMDLMEISGKSEMGTAFEEIFCEVEGSELTIGFNPKFLIDALRAIDDETVKIYFVAQLDPCIIVPTFGDSYKYLVLPLRL
ncbi:MAG: DNA polymerase III subunit beta [Bacillota bacterium]